MLDKIGIGFGLLGCICLAALPVEGIMVIWYGSVVMGKVLATTAIVAMSGILTSSVCLKIDEELQKGCWFE
jgi:hypothetical protein